MESLGVAFLGVIALGSVVQTVFLVVLASEGKRLARRIEELQAHFDRELRPILDNLARTSRNLAEVSDLATLQARRIDELIADTVGKVEEVTTVFRRFVTRPLGPVLDVLAFFKGIRRGLDVYRTLRGHDARERAPLRRYQDEDEHLFI
jgi:hypothetical protein